MSTAQESCNTQCKHIMSCERLNYLEYKNTNYIYKLFTLESKVCKLTYDFPHRKEPIQTWTFCIKRSWGSTEIDSMYTQKAQRIRKKKLWAVAGWIKKAATTQGTICAKSSLGKECHPSYLLGNKELPTVLPLSCTKVATGEVSWLRRKVMLLLPEAKATSTYLFPKDHITSFKNLHNLVT